MSEVLGKISFLDTPDVNGSNVLLDGGGVPTILAGITSARPTAGVTGRLFLDITTNIFYRDNGTTWDSLAVVPLVDGTANEVNVVDGTNVTPTVISLADNLVMPGTAAFTQVSGTTAQRPASPAAGMARYNTTINAEEYFNGTGWISGGGNVLQVVTGTIPATSFTGVTIPLDTTVPLVTEGQQIWSQVFTPTTTTSKIIITFNLQMAHSTAGRSQITALFAGSANIGALITYTTTASAGFPMCMHAIYSPGSTAAITFSARVGSNTSSGTSYINQAGTNTLGGALVTEYSIIEVL